MRKFIPIFVIVAAGFFLRWDNIQTLFFILKKPLVSIKDYSTFTNDFKTITVLITFSMYLLLVYLPCNESAAEMKGSARLISSFLVVMGIFIMLITITNPVGRFPWHKRDLYVSFSTYNIKPDLYRDLTATPDLIFFGSSVSLMLPADSLRKNWDMDAFNMSIAGGAPNDFLALLKFVLETSPDHQVPSVITVEIVRRGLSLNTASGSQAPLALVPYMDLDQKLETVSTAADHVVKLNSVSDSIFTLLVIDKNRWQTWINFISTGTGVQKIKNTSYSRYQQAVMKNISMVDNFLYCEKLDPKGVEYIEKLVALAREYKIGIVFYTAPINSDFYTMGNIDAKKYDFCRWLLTDYMKRLVRQNPNVFSRDLSDYKPIATKGLKTYLDTHHLTRQGSALLLNILHSDIESAKQWAEENRQP